MIGSAGALEERANDISPSWEDEHMSIDIKTAAVEEKRITFDHIARKLGEGKKPNRYQEVVFGQQPEEVFHYRPTWDPERELYDVRRTAIQMQDFEDLLDPRQYYYATYVIQRSRQQESQEKNYSVVEKRGLLDNISDELFYMVIERASLVWHSQVKQVIIHKLVDGVFYSSIICERDKIEEIIDARTSDAIALALRFQAPIFTYKNILDKAGIYLKINPEKEDESEEDSVLVDDLIAEELETGSIQENYKSKTLDELHNLLDEAVANEDYEKAAKIRDEISKR